MKLKYLLFVIVLSITATAKAQIEEATSRTYSFNIGGGSQTDYTPDGTSDVDKNIPTTRVVNSNTFVVVIANQNYKYVSKVPWALNDGSVFRQYCIKALGIPSENIFYAPDATLNDMRFSINRLSNVLKSYKGEGKAIIYYSGHGVPMPDPDGKSFSQYLFPVDAYDSDITTAYSLKELYGQLRNVPSESVTCFLDACFSGANKQDEALAGGGRSVAIQSKKEPVSGNIVVFSAASKDQTAWSYDEKQHGLFTYFLLKKIQDNTNVDYNSLSIYISDNVAKVSSNKLKKVQTPTMVFDNSIADDWKSWKLKY